MSRKPTSYWEYVEVEQLLSLQGGLEENDDGLLNDEVLFITIHQIDELWFKLVLRELSTVRDLFAQPRVPEQALAAAARGIRRVAEIFDKAADHFSLMETMTTRDYLGFRDKLSPASGFQSAQLREIEILLGLSDAQRIPLGHEHSYLDALKQADGSPSPASERVERRLRDTPSLRDAVFEWLYRTPIAGSSPDDEGDGARVQAFVDAYVQAMKKENDNAADLATHDALTPADGERLRERYRMGHEASKAFLEAREAEGEEKSRLRRIRAALVMIESYRELPLLAWPREVLDALVAMEQSMLIFRQRHARIVERVIGRRIGTGGSAGVDYLDRTALEYRVLGDVWAVRTLLVRREALPPLAEADAYRLAPGD